MWLKTPEHLLQRSLISIPSPGVDLYIIFFVFSTGQRGIPALVTLHNADRNVKNQNQKCHIPSSFTPFDLWLCAFQSLNQLVKRGLVIQLKFKSLSSSPSRNKLLRYRWVFTGREKGSSGNFCQLWTAWVSNNWDLWLLNYTKVLTLISFSKKVKLRDKKLHYTREGKIHVYYTSISDLKFALGNK